VNQKFVAASSVAPNGRAAIASERRRAPLRRHPHPARARGFPTAWRPPVLASVPDPVTLDPEVPTPGLARHHLNPAGRRRPKGDVDFCHSRIGVSGNRGRRGRRRGRRRSGDRLPVSRTENPLAVFVHPTRIDPDSAWRGRLLPTAAHPDVAAILPSPVATDPNVAWRRGDWPHLRPKFRGWHTQAHRLFARFPASFMFAYFSSAFGRFPIPGRALLIPDFAPALAVQTLAIHALAIQTLAIHALAIQTLAIHALAVLACTVFLLAPLGLLKLARLLVGIRPHGQRSSESEQKDSGGYPNSHGVLLECVLYGRTWSRFNSIFQHRPPPSAPRIRDSRLLRRPPAARLAGVDCVGMLR
jgi:hypothetical protein